MKKSIALCLAGALGIAATGSAIAACPGGTALTAAQLTTLLAGNTICAVSGGDKWQEQHRAGGQLWDFKRGIPPAPGASVDPTAQVGTWSITAGSRTSPAGSITHNYGGANVFTYNVFGTGVVGTSHNFCNAATSVVGTVQLGVNSACP